MTKEGRRNEAERRRRSRNRTHPSPPHGAGAEASHGVASLLNGLALALALALAPTNLLSPACTPMCPSPVWAFIVAVAPAFPSHVLCVCLCPCRDLCSWGAPSRTSSRVVCTRGM